MSNIGTVRVRRAHLQLSFLGDASLGRTADREAGSANPAGDSGRRSNPSDRTSLPARFRGWLCALENTGGLCQAAEREGLPYSCQADYERRIRNAYGMTN